MTLEKCIRWLTLKHGSLRALSRNTGVDVGYLSRLRVGDCTAPSDETLNKLGIARVIDFKLEKTAVEKMLTARNQKI